MRGRCFGCGSSAHIKKDGNHGSLRCNHCQRLGHSANVCQDKFMGYPPGRGLTQHRRVAATQEAPFSLFDDSSTPAATIAATSPAPPAATSSNVSLADLLVAQKNQQDILERLKKIQQQGCITHFARLELTVDGYSEWTDFLITDLGGEDVILGLPWLRKINPQIDWRKGTLEISPPRISSVTIEEVPDEDAQPPRKEPPSGNAIIEQIYNDPDPPVPTAFDDSPAPNPDFQPSEPPLCRIRANRVTRRKWVRKGLIEDTGDELWCAAGFTYSQQIAEKSQKDKPQKTFEESCVPFIPQATPRCIIM
ncbi:hypothetical protein CC1G_10916 [Coprinopsis cinerea okayama7|uniref:CCHC-type domain-containing protein n=1 Tax=Coprinopsis cinerea (strain Okayama-7 / 130 / ATCC MYA-4618 / FGSC 9003) TaxID=240176 RepID=A8P5Z1_COPC7|nr:hypothetical protein CC1G_10916 [Coprinopsis cinerea okayama7\|eukprot:XP_001839053.2 hypothetical protein CC1G_10916 [Coprinopsis cinerea okayama7\